jgi:uncharacterized protein YfdQ (DUF2303 family)
MTYNSDTETNNLVESIVAHMPAPDHILELGFFRDNSAEPHSSVHHIAVPKDFEVKTFDDEKLQSTPRRAVGTATLGDDESFLAYVDRHCVVSTAAWVHFAPAQSRLAFSAVINDHMSGTPGWRDHKATFVPETSHEWKTWMAANGKRMSQVDFAEFIEENEKDIAGGDGLPSSLEMLSMAKNFEANSDKSFKSKVNTQSGGVELVFVDSDNAETQSRMKLFARFQVGIPVFWSTTKDGSPITAWPLQARLKYSTAGGKLTFWYELIRPDVVHELASMNLIAKIKASLGGVPLYTGAFNG